MRDLDRALADIGAIRHQIARADGFRFYGPATVAGTGLLAAAVATGQWLAGPVPGPFAFFAAWIAAAAASVVIVGAEAATRSRRLRSRLADAMILAAASDFLPAGLAGAGVALVLLRFEPAACWMLPGIWQVLVGLGYCAASRSLPRTMAWVGGWYMATGLAVLGPANAGHALSPWVMGVPFAAGQIGAALLLRRSLELPDE